MKLKNNMKSKKVALLILVCLAISKFNSLSAQNLNTVYPREYINAISNPFKGFRPDPGKTMQDSYPTIVREYIKWNEVENSESDGADKIIEHCNKLWKGFEEKNIKVAAQIYIDWDSKQGNEYWPHDIVDELGWPTWDVRYWRSNLVKERIEKLIYKLGEAWDNDPRVAWVNTAIVGYWGEQENPVGVDEEGYVELMGEAFSKAFKNKKLLVRNQKYWDPKGYKWGVGWGSFAHPGQTSGSWTDIRRTTANGQYLTQIVGGEVAYNWGYDVFVPVMGSSPTITLGTDKYTNYIIDVIRELHCTGLGWISGYKLDGTDNTSPAVVKANASKMQKAFGYRFILPEFSCSPRASQNDSLKISFKVQNTGSAPFYYLWETAFVLIDETTHEIVWKEALPNVDCRNWQPGKNYNYSTRQYNLPAPVYEISASLAVPDSIKTGQYMAGITILEPFSGTPGVFFAVENFLKKSQAQPLCRIGIGEDLAGSHEIDASLFTDPLVNDTRYYTLTPQGKTYSVSGDTPNGSLEFMPRGGTYVPGTKVTVKAVGNVGYAFDDWGGEFSGKGNSITVVMDGDKTISASFKEVPTFTLNIKPEYGSVLLGPPGGEYSEGTVVTLTPKPNPGYYFEQWMGDIDGADNPATITMDADKTVTARFVYAGFGGIATAINCGGSNYLSTEGNTFSADTGGGSTYSTSANISGTDDDQLYQTERYGKSFSYDIPLENGNYQVTLMFAEIYHSEAGNRVFNVSIEGEQVISNLDIFAKAGYNAAYNEIHEVNITDGQINIAFTTLIDNAKISAIKIVSKVDEIETFTLTTDAMNGAIEAKPAEGPYPAGSNVLLTAIPDTGFMFTGWSGDLAGSVNPATLYMTGTKNVSATFVETNWYTLTTSATNGTISTNPAKGIYGYAEGTEVTFTAIPDERYMFTGWSGDLSGTGNPATLVFDSNKTVTANFENPNALLLTINSGNGTVQVTPAQESYSRGASVILIATPDKGYKFVGWEGDITGSDNPKGLVIDRNKNIKAVFSEITSTIDFTGNSTQTILMQNYPNPFSAETTIQYTLNNASDVKLTVYNVLGHQVVGLVDEYQQAGSHSVTWQANDSKGKQIAGGLYIYRLETGNNVIQMKKASLIKK